MIDGDKASGFSGQLQANSRAICLFRSCARTQIAVDADIGAHVYARCCLRCGVRCQRRQTARGVMESTLVRFAIVEIAIGMRAIHVISHFNRFLRTDDK
jgi:hypothetical protein